MGIATDLDKALERIRPGFASAKRFVKPIWDRRNSNFRRYTGPLTNKRPSRKEDFHVPYTSTLLNNVWPLLAARIPISDVRPRNESRDAEAARLMRELIQYTWDVNVFDLTYLMSVKTSQLFNDAWVKVCWEYYDSATDHPSIKLLNSFDVIPHPRKIFLDDRWPMYIRSEMTKSEMIEMGWDKGQIKKLGESKLETESYRQEQLSIMGYSDEQIQKAKEDKTDDVYEVVETWGMQDLSFSGDNKEQMAYVVMANDQQILNTDNVSGKERFASPYNHDKIPLAHLPYDALPNMLLGEGFIDPIASQQDELDALEYQKAENYRRRNNPPLKVRRSGRVDLSTLKYVNSLPWVMNSPDDVTPHELPDIATSIEAQQDRIKSVMQARTGANDVLLVSDYTDIKGGDTATGASIANENTKMRFRPQATLQDLFVERIGSLCISMYQDPRLFDRGKAIAIADEEGKYSETLIKPEKIRGDLQFKVNAASGLAESDREKLETAVYLKELYIEDQSINQDEFDKVVFEAAGYDYNKVKRSKEEMMGVLAQKLQELVAMTQRPEFAEMPPAQQQSIIERIKSMKQMLEQGQGAQEQDVGAEATQTQEVPTQGGEGI